MKTQVKIDIYVNGKYCSAACKFWDNEGGHSTCSLFYDDIEEVRDVAPNVFSKRSKKCMDSEL